MKKFAAALIMSGLFCGVSNAGEAEHRTMLMKDMRTMIEAMEQIQRGGFYSSTEDMKQGVKKLQGTLKTLETEDVKWILPKDQKYAYQFAQKSAQMIRMYSDEMLVSIEKGKIDYALEDYTQILKQCTSCHMRIRKW